MPKTKQTFVALFRTQWTSAKGVVPPAALKRVDFSKGLGPVLDKLEKKWDAAADLDPVPAKAQAELLALVGDVQKVIRGYTQQVITANKADPGNGPAWWALHEALRKIDSGVVDDVKDLGVKVAALKIWAGKEDFDRTAGKLGPAGPASDKESAAYRAQGFATLEAKLDRVAAQDLVGFAKALDNGLGTSLPHARQLVMQLRQYTAALATTTNDFQRHVNAADKGQATAMAKRARQIVVEFAKKLPPEGKKIGSRAAAHVVRMDQAVPA